MFLAAPFYKGSKVKLVNKTGTKVQATDTMATVEARGGSEAYTRLLWASSLTTMLTKDKHSSR